jgi:hypothetical protein
MDTAADRYNNFLVRSGAGRDAAGRTVYTGPNMLYMGPRDFAATKEVHAGLGADLMAEREQKAKIESLRMAAYQEAQRQRQEALLNRLSQMQR